MNEMQWEVDCILAERTRKRRKEYLVAWKTAKIKYSEMLTWEMMRPGHVKSAKNLPNGDVLVVWNNSWESSKHIGNYHKKQFSITKEKCKNFGDICEELHYDLQLKKVISKCFDEWDFYN